MTLHPIEPRLYLRVCDPSERTCQLYFIYATSSIAIVPMSVEKATPITALTNTKWTKPEYILPTPSLMFAFHLECDMEKFTPIGQGPYGKRANVIFRGGRFEGPEMRGSVLPGGGGTKPPPRNIQ